MLLNICVSLALLVFVQNVQCDLLAIRQTSNGPIVGIELMSSLGQKYVAFKGVRYAMPPITGTDPLTGDRVDRRFKVCDFYKIFGKISGEKYENFSKKASIGNFRHQNQLN